MKTINQALKKAKRLSALTEKINKLKQKQKTSALTEKINKLKQKQKTNAKELISFINENIDSTELEECGLTLQFIRDLKC